MPVPAVYAMQVQAGQPMLALVVLHIKVPEAHAMQVQVGHVTQVQAGLLTVVPEVRRLLLQVGQQILVPEVHAMQVQAGQHMQAPVDHVIRGQAELGKIVLQYVKNNRETSRTAPREALVVCDTSCHSATASFSRSLVKTYASYASRETAT